MLSKARTWIIVGYSLPRYDRLVSELLFQSSQHGPALYVFDPDAKVAPKYTKLLRTCSVEWHPGLPEGLRDVEVIVKAHLAGRTGIIRHDT